MTSVIDAIENTDVMSNWRLSDMALGRLVKEVHEFHCLAFEACHHAVDAGNEIVVGKEGYHAHDEAGHGCDEGFIDAAGKDVDVGARSGRCQVVECLDHADYRSEEAEHRGAGCCGGQPGKAFAEGGDFKVSSVLDGHEDIVHRAAYAADAFGDEAAGRGVGALAQTHGVVKLPFVDIVADAVHEGAVGAVGAAYGQKPFNEYVDGYDAEERERNHDETAFEAEFPKRKTLLDRFG